ncbi:MAG TPA: hypothetical protein PLA03_13365, partial [Acidobacteriota bacterium]|nr:hypothetical protein [Acidobacteriota bacterium]
MKLYKLTDKDGYTRRGEEHETKWGEGVTHRARSKGRELCTDQVIHAYEHPLLAVLHNPIHANIANPVLWEARGKIVAREGMMKCGCKNLTTIKPLPLPEITLKQRIRYAIGCAWKVCYSPKWRKWAIDYWLSGVDRSDESAAEAAEWAGVRAAERAAAEAAERAARAAEWAAARAAERA